MVLKEKNLCCNDCLALIGVPTLFLVLVTDISLAPEPETAYGVDEGGIMMNRFSSLFCAHARRIQRSRNSQVGYTCIYNFYIHQIVVARFVT